MDPLAYKHYSKARFLQRSDGRQVIHTGNLGISNGDLYLSNLSIADQFIHHQQVLPDCVLNVFDCLFYRSLLATSTPVAPDKTRCNLLSIYTGRPCISLPTPSRLYTLANISTLKRGKEQERIAKSEGSRAKRDICRAVWRK